MVSLKSVLQFPPFRTSGFFWPEYSEDGTSYECGVLFLIQMKGCKRFGPDDNIHPEFGRVLRNARKAGVEIFVIDCKVAPDSLVADKPVTLIL